MPDTRTIREADASGSRLDLLVVLRDTLARRLDQGMGARELASCIRGLLEITLEIESVKSTTSADSVGSAAATPRRVVGRRR